jgi:hypothetical protein
MAKRLDLPEIASHRYVAKHMIIKSPAILLRDHIFLVCTNSSSSMFANYLTSLVLHVREQNERMSIFAIHPIK